MPHSINTWLNAYSPQGYPASHIKRFVHSHGGQLLHLHPVSNWQSVLIAVPIEKVFSLCAVLEEYCIRYWRFPLTQRQETSIHQFLFSEKQP